MSECVFCSIVSGHMPATRVYEDKLCLAFFDIRPAAEGHTLVVPKRHVERIESVPDQELMELVIAVKKVSRALQKALKADGINTVSNSGVAAGQIVFHAHVHLLPRFEGDGKPTDWGGRQQFDAEKAEELAKRIAQEMKNA